jgi:hypothetical protein
MLRGNKNKSHVLLPGCDQANVIKSRNTPIGNKLKVSKNIQSLITVRIDIPKNYLETLTS